MVAKYATKAARFLAVGDTIQVWWGMKQATVVAFRSHNSGQEGWTVADFADGYSMTITPFDVVRVLT
jgi:hypothetical protein